MHVEGERHAGENGPIEPEYEERQRADGRRSDTIVFRRGGGSVV